MKRHDIWRKVEKDYQEVLKRAPDGYEPVVQVYVAGRDAPITLGFARTRRDPDDVWISFEAAAEAVGDEESDVLPAECYWVHVPETCVLGIEISFRRTGRAPIGFRYSESDE